MAEVSETSFSVEIETWGVARVPDDTLAELADALDERGLGGTVTSLGGLAGGVGATMRVHGGPSGTPAEAVRLATEAFAEACEQVGIEHGGIARVDLMTDAYLDRWLALEPERYAGVSEIAALFGVSRQRVAELRAKPGFPAPVAELSSGPVWKVSSLRLFLEAWDRRPGRPRKTKTA